MTLCPEQQNNACILGNSLNKFAMMAAPFNFTSHNAKGYTILQQD